MPTRKTRLRTISANDKLIIDDETGQVLGITPDARTPFTLMAYVEPGTGGQDVVKNPKTGDEVGGIGNAQVQNGVAIVNIGGSPYALLPVDGNGDVVANIGHRTGLLADLLTMDGNAGEIGVATDQYALVLFNGVAGQARLFKRTDNPNALGTDSIAIGANASTPAVAEKSLALGHTATAHVRGMTAIAGAITGIQTLHSTLGVRTTDASGSSMSTSGTVDSALGDTIKLPIGVYDIEVTIVARQIGSANWARFVRRFMFRASSTTSVFGTVATPIADEANNLAGLAVSFTQYTGGYLLINVTGLAGATIQWAAYVRANALTINT